MLHVTWLHCYNMLQCHMVTLLQVTPRYNTSHGYIVTMLHVTSYNVTWLHCYTLHITHQLCVSLWCPLHYIWIGSLFCVLFYAISVSKKILQHNNMNFYGCRDLYIVLVTFTKGRPDKVSHEAIVKVGIKRCNTGDSVGLSDNQCR